MNHEPTIIEWVVYAFEKDPGDALIAEWKLPNAEREQLRAILEVPPDDPMHDSYPVKTEQQGQALSRLFGVPIDLSAYDYFVECWSVPDPAWLARCEPHWIIFIYEKYPGAKVGELELPGATPEALRAIMGHPEDTNEYPAYAVTTEEQARKLSRLTESPLDLSTYHYVVHAVPVPRTGSA